MSNWFEQPTPTSPRRQLRGGRAQSFIELALVLPVLFIILLGVVEVAIFIGRYLDVLDLTREVARQAAREERFTSPAAFFAEVDSYLNTPPVGLNSYITMNPATDDMVVSVFDLRGSGERILHVWSDTNENYKKDCEGNTVRTEPHFTLSEVMAIGSPDVNEGMVAVEIFYCHQLVLNIPFITSFIPNPVQIHAYTIFPFPAIKYR
ncbi:MAG: TadE/TadG family type IV pilus assembly protein [Chloroflexota bacterium]